MTKKELREAMTLNGYEELENTDMLFSPTLTSNMSIDFVSKYIMNLSWSLILRYRKYSGDELFKLFKTVLKKLSAEKYEGKGDIESLVSKIIGFQTIDEKTFNNIVDFISNTDIIKDSTKRTNLKGLFIRLYMEEQTITPEFYIQYKNHCDIRMLNTKANPWCLIENMPNNIKVLINLNSISLL